MASCSRLRLASIKLFFPISFYVLMCVSGGADLHKSLTEIGVADLE